MAASDGTQAQPHDAVDSTAGPPPARPPLNDNHAAVASDATGAAAAPAIVVDDVPGEGYGAIEAVPGFDAARLFADDAPEALAPDAWEAFAALDDAREGAQDFAGPSYEGDGRVRIATTGAPPWQWICQLVIRNPDGTRTLATGWLASPNVVVTCGRAVFDHVNGWAREIEVIPGLDGARRPWGSMLSQNFQTVRGWFDNHDPDCDYGAILLLDDGFNSIGQFGLAAMASASLVGQAVNSVGYPGHAQRGTQWFDACRLGRVSETRLFHGPDTYLKPAGSPLWLQTNLKGRPQRLVCGLAGFGGAADSAIRVTGEVLRRIESWKTMAAKPKPAAAAATAVPATTVPANAAPASATPSSAPSTNPAPSANAAPSAGATP